MTAEELDMWLEWQDDGSVVIHHPGGWRVALEDEDETLLRPLGTDTRLARQIAREIRGRAR